MEVVADGGCFVCGKENPGGLQAVFALGEKPLPGV